MNMMQTLLDLKDEYLGKQKEYKLVLLSLKVSDSIGPKEQDLIDTCEDVLRKVDELIVFINVGIENISKNN